MCLEHRDLLLHVASNKGHALGVRKGSFRSSITNIWFSRHGQHVWSVWTWLSRFGRWNSNNMFSALGCNGSREKLTRKLHWSIATTAALTSLKMLVWMIASWGKSIGWVRSRVSSYLKLPRGRQQCFLVEHRGADESTSSFNEDV